MIILHFFSIGTKYSDETVNECEKKLAKLTDAYCDCLPDMDTDSGDLYNFRKSGRIILFVQKENYLLLRKIIGCFFVKIIMDVVLDNYLFALTFSQPFYIPDLLVMGLYKPLFYFVS